MAKVQLIVCVLVYWVLLSILFGLDGTPFVDTAGYNITGEVNSSDVDLATEINSGGFFGGVIGIFSAGVRFFGLIAFGIGLPPPTPAWLQGVVTLFNLIVFLATLLLIISIFWDG